MNPVFVKYLYLRLIKRIKMSLDLPFREQLILERISTIVLIPDIILLHTTITPHLLDIIIMAILQLLQH